MIRNRQQTLNIYQKKLMLERRHLSAERSLAADLGRQAGQVVRLKVKKFRQVREELLKVSRDSVLKGPQKLEQLKLLDKMLGQDAAGLKQSEVQLQQSQQVIARLAREQLQLEQRVEKLSALQRDFINAAAEEIDQQVLDQGAIWLQIAERSDREFRPVLHSEFQQAGGVLALECNAGLMHQPEFCSHAETHAAVQSEREHRSGLSQSGSQSDASQNRQAEATQITFAYAEAGKRATEVLVTMSAEGALEIELGESHSALSAAQEEREIRAYLERDGLEVDRVTVLARPVVANA